MLTTPVFAAPAVFAVVVLLHVGPGVMVGLAVVAPVLAPLQIGFLLPIVRLPRVGAAGMCALVLAAAVIVAVLTPILGPVLAVLVLLGVRPRLLAVLVRVAPGAVLVVAFGHFQFSWSFGWLARC
jgi:hypothetical protein